MKKIWIIMTLTIILAGQAQATLFFDGFFDMISDKKPSGIGINSDEEANQSCSGEYMFMEEIRLAKQYNITDDLLEIPDEGYHVVHLNKGDYEGYEYYTALIEDGKIKWIKGGICAGEEEYEVYNINYNVKKIWSDLEAFDYNYVKLGWHINSKVEGINFIQKMKAVQVLVKRGVLDQQSMAKI